MLIIYRLQDSHRVRIGAIPMKNLFSTLKLIVEWINDGMYDFYTLPKAMKRPLRERDKQKILEMHKSYVEGMFKVIYIISISTFYSIL